VLAANRTFCRVAALSLNLAPATLAAPSARVLEFLMLTARADEIVLWISLQWVFCNLHTQKSQKVHAAAIPDQVQIVGPEGGVKWSLGTPSVP